MSEHETLAVVAASPARRWAGIGMLGALGALTIYVAFSSPPELHWQVFLLAVGAGAFWGARRMHAATENHVELTEEVLREGNGRLIVRVDEIESIDRGAFAFKPSNGFLIRTTTSQPRRWQPGLWWSLGRRIGVGGVTPGQQTKMMSDILSAMLAKRERGDRE
jgi:hypothetical protein